MRRALPLLVVGLAALCCCCEATDRPIWAILSQPNRVSGDSDTPAFKDMPADYAFINSGTCRDKDDGRGHSFDEGPTALISID